MPMNLPEGLGEMGTRHILYATDLSPTAERALPYALGIAFRHAAVIYVVHVIQPAVYPLVPPVAWAKMATDEETFRQNAKAALEEQLKDVRHEFIFRSGEIWKTLSEVIHEKQIDLIVCSTHGRSGLGKALLGSVAEKIFQNSSRPVLTVGPLVSKDLPGHGALGRILYATDFSHESLAAAPESIALAQEHRANLILLHCLEDSGDLRTMLTTLRDLVPYGVELRGEPNCVVARGPHGDKILEVAEGHGADLIVLGVPSEDLQRGPKAHFRRSALYKIVTQARCPVLTMHH